MAPLRIAPVSERCALQASKLPIFATQMKKVLITKMLTMNKKLKGTKCIGIEVE